MPAFDVFNGDADGICSLLQLRQVNPRTASLITGVKRDIALLERVTVDAGDEVTVLDISMDKNKVALERVLAAGAQVFYADHHYAGDIPVHAGLQALINTSPEVSTSLLVNGHLQGAKAGWAVVGCFGDNLDASAERLARTLCVEPDLERWRELGVLINYNGYGAAIGDLHFPPAELYERLLPHATPAACLAEDPDLFLTLQAAYADDMARASSAPRLVDNDVLGVMVLPDTPWARRVSGVYGNHLANTYPDRAHAVLTVIPQGYLVSVRAPLSNRSGADVVCRQFETGGGRAAAAGINVLPEDQVNRLIELLTAQYST